LQLLEAKEIQIEWADVGLSHFKNIFAHLYRYVTRATKRSDGVHVSDVIKEKWFGSSSGDERRRKEAEAATELQDPSVMPLRMVLGMAWELFVIGLYKSLQWQPGELSCDGISGSPDGFGAYRGERTIEEFKFTWKSSRNRDILKELIWIWQVAAYCWMSNCRVARLHVCWVNGDYERGNGEWGPKYFVYVIKFEKHELTELWKKVFMAGKDKVMRRMV